ncbi:MAG: S41 family peptidase [Bacilli bacterium]|nr:S41 family peptidase [Bacilli bacterium]
MSKKQKTEIKNLQTDKKKKKNNTISSPKKNVDEYKEKDYFTSSEVVIIAIIAIAFGCLLGSIIALKTSNKSTSKEVEEFTVAYNTLLNNYYKKIDKKKLISSAIEGMFKYLDDPYTVYMDKEETESFNQTMDGKYKGIGATISKYDDEIHIVGIFKNSPAAKAGVHENDIIISVNGTSTKDKTADEVVKLIKSKNTATIKIKRDKEEKTYKIKLEEVIIPSVESEIIEKNNKKVGVITIGIFAANTYQQFNTELKELEKNNIDAIIIDVRSNTGGYLDQASKILSLFMDKSKVIYQIESNNKKTKYYSNGTQNKNYKVAVLVNEGSASASEILAAAFKESYNAEIIGIKTYGKGTVQTAQKLDSGSSIKITIENWLTPKGNSINKKGIEPTIKVELAEEYYEKPSKDTDNQLQKALEIVSKKD